MAGGAQGGGGRPAQGQGQRPQFNPQGGQQFQQALQNYRQGSMGMPSQAPGANMAAPGGNMMQNPAGYGPPQQTLPMYAGPAPAPQQMIGTTRPMQAPLQPAPAPQPPQQMMGNTRPMQLDNALQQMPPAQQQQMEALGAQIRAQNMAPQSFNRPNIGGNRLQIQGNPNAMPVQRPATKQQRMQDIMANFR